jgi:acetylornithine aminotransferase/acetylornithine/N-succinyldiaminopimelate aminotransferase
MTPQVSADYAECVLGNYGTAALELVHGDGVWVTDSTGKRYLDFGSGIAVTALGHGHPSWVRAVQDQAARLAHVSNLYAHAGQGALARKLCEQAGPGKVFFCNSGAEANETCLKLARLHGLNSTGTEGRRTTVLTAHNGFHGRTFGAMSATPQGKIQDGFRPLLSGFAHAALNDLSSFEALIDASTAAIFVETIQGEGGLTATTPEFLQGLRQLCDKHQLLLILDEVQCGIGRTGDFFAYQASGVQPDAVAMAKGLGGGFPVGAVWLSQTCSKYFTPGSHGTTFGGNPLACAAALAVIEVMEQKGLLEHVQRLSRLWHQQLGQLQKAFPELVRDVRGRGFMIGLGLHIDPKVLVEQARLAGLLCVPAGQQVLRLLPPLIATQTHLEQATQLLEQALQTCRSQLCPNTR